jgi:hypothetical protein
LEKYPLGQLAGGLPYRIPGSNGGIGKTYRKVTRPDPTHLECGMTTSHLESSSSEKGM